MPSELALIVTSLDQLAPLLPVMPGCMAIKDCNSVYVSATQAIPGLIGYRNPDEMVGITDYDLKAPVVEFADEFVRQDQRVLAGEPEEHIDINRYFDGVLHVFLTKKTRIVDVEGKSIGTFFNMTELSEVIVRTLVERLLVNYTEQHYDNLCGSYRVGNNSFSHKLSPRESDCLYYLVRGETLKSTGLRLGIAHTTVASYLRTAMEKLGCLNRTQLIEKAIELGFLFKIPNGVLKKTD